jgi:peptidoglycan/LPS O-acetylase OafA/YrhL
LEQGDDLTHMFVVFAFFGLFKAVGKELCVVPLLFVAVILASGWLGESTARFYSEPMNRMLRRRFSDGTDRLGSVLPSDANRELQS